MIAVQALLIFCLFPFLISSADSKTSTESPSTLTQKSSSSTKSASGALSIDLLARKRHQSLDELYDELTEHRLRQRAGSWDISWALIFYSMPAVVVNMILCASFIHVIVTDYVEYVHVINE